MNDSAKSQWIVDALDRHEASLVRYANWILGDIESAREVVQETFLRLCKEQQSRVGAYLAQWILTPMIQNGQPMCWAKWKRAIAPPWSWNWNPPQRRGNLSKNFGSRFPS